MTSISSSESLSKCVTELEVKEQTCREETEVIKSNIVMFEFRDQLSSMVGEEVEHFASFFDNECDLFEKVNPLEIMLAK